MKKTLPLTLLLSLIAVWGVWVVTYPPSNLPALIEAKNFFLAYPLYFIPPFLEIGILCVVGGKIEASWALMALNVSIITLIEVALLYEIVFLLF